MSSKRTGSVPETSKQRDHPSQETLKEIQFQVWTLLSIFILFLRFFFHDKKMTLEDKKRRETPTGTCRQRRLNLESKVKEMR